MDPAPKALLVDYGGVICFDQPAETIEQMATLAGLEVPVFIERYWQHRHAYDEGLTQRAYWSMVLQDDPADGQLERLVALDLEGWSHLNADTLEILHTVHGQGTALSLLSNAPHDLADALTGHPELSNFEHMVFSSRIGVAKPEPAAFAAALEQIGREPSEVVFIDDRPENVEGAERAGLRALRFTSSERLRSILLG